MSGITRLIFPNGDEIHARGIVFMLYGVARNDTAPTQTGENMNACGVVGALSRLALESAPYHVAASIKDAMDHHNQIIFMNKKN